ncbi:hypothetical protein RIF29_04798 [Crotalaria pallida]|uniref:Cathepsin propeptide inhibitor domain-containing protein n=1 Tax=Crotalaria pallida TaxID=3830 RepID=A0AAN9J254_CROPI
MVAPTIKLASGRNSILGYNLDKRPSQDEAIQLFQLWKNENGRVYKNLEEMAKKFEIFIYNLNYIIDTNAKRSSSSSYVLGLNEFADWSPEEFKETYLHELNLSIDNNDIKLNDMACQAPSSLDWRTRGVVTPVKNQGSCGKFVCECKISPKVINIAMTV